MGNISSSVQSIKLESSERNAKRFLVFNTDEKKPKYWVGVFGQQQQPFFSVEKATEFYYAGCA